MFSRVDQTRVLFIVAALTATTALVSLTTRHHRNTISGASVVSTTSSSAAHLYFEQAATTPARFVARGLDYMLTLTGGGATLTARRGDALSELELAFVDSNPFTTLQSTGASAPVAHYYLGNDPIAWRRNVSLSEQVAYRNLYPGIDAVFYGQGRAFEYDFVVAPHADASRLRLRFSHQERMTIDRAGDLLLTTPAGVIRQQHPVAYQTVNGEKSSVAASYALTATGDVRIDLGDYDTNYPLIIDPVLDFSTFFGASNVDTAMRVAVDPNGNTYTVGYTFSTDLKPTSAHGPGGGTGDTVNVFVTKHRKTGELDYVAFLGGSNEDYGRDIAVNANGVAYLTGETYSADFPVTGTAPRKFGGEYDAFVSVLSSDGKNLIYSGTLGGGGPDYGHGIALGPNGTVYVAGETWSVDFPVTPATAYSTDCNGCGPDSYDGFLAVLDTAKDAPLYSTYYGGSGHDKIHSVAVGAQTGVAYIAGESFSTDLPVVNALQPENAGKSDVIVAAINPNTAGRGGLIYASYLGGSDEDSAAQVALNGAGHLYVAGATSSADLQTKNAYQTKLHGTQDALVAKFNTGAAAGSSLLFATYFGGDGADSAESIAVNASDAPVIAGMTSSTDLPTVLPAQRALAGTEDGFVAALSVGGNTLQFATYIGGPDHDALDGVAVAPEGMYVAVGDTDSGSFPIAGGAPQHTKAGAIDAVLVRLDPSSTSTAPATTPPATSSTPAAGGGSLDMLWWLAFAFAPFRRYRAGA